VSRAPFAVVLTLAPGVVRTWISLIGVTGETRLTDGPLMDALEDGAPFDHVLAVGTPRAGRDVQGMLEVLTERLLLAWQVRDADGTPLATLVPLLAGVPLVEPSTSAGTTSLSRFALMRPTGSTWLLESGRSPWTATLTAEAAGHIAEGTGPHELWDLLRLGGLLADSDAGALPFWEFHDRYFASRSLMDIGPSGGSFRFAGTRDPEPARVDPPHRDTVISLPVPAADDVGPGIWDVSERRTTIYDTNDDPVSLDALGSLLWHTLRVTASSTRDPDVPTSYDTVHRPVPSGGGTHSIGTWLWCNKVAGVTPGIWWYDPWAHALRLVSDDPSLAFQRPAPINGVLVSRFGRLAWKYERIAYALALKDSGVILHALQSSAVALGLALCPIGGGVGGPILKALGLSADEYTPVGEFWIGNPR